MNETRKFGLGKERMNQWLVGLASGALLFWAEHFINTQIVGLENLKAAVNHVNGGKGGLLITPNHSSYLDAISMNLIRKEIAPNKKFTTIWANKFEGKDEGKYAGTGQENMNNVLLAGKIGNEAAKRIGIRLVTVPQAVTNPGEARKLARIFESLGKETLGNNDVLGVFPEGTRSRDGNLGEGKSFLKFLFSDEIVSNTTLIIPIGIVGTGNYMRPDTDKINPFSKVTIIYGRPYTVIEAQKEMKDFGLSNLSDVMMWHIAQLLPEEKWGVYKDSFQKIKASQVKI